MPTSLPKTVIGKFPLRLMPSMRSTVERFSRQEGVSLNQFINVAVAERVARLEYEEWNRKRAQMPEGHIEKALAILDNGPDVLPEPGDELPEGYVSVAAQTVSLAKTAR